MALQFKRKYGEATTIPLELYEVDGVDLKVDATFEAGDVVISKDEGAEANTTNLPADEGNGYSLALTATEMEAARITIYVIDSATKTWLDRTIIIDTYGNASAQHAFDLDDASPEMDLTDGAITAAKIGADAITNAKIADNAIAAENIAADAITNAKIADNAIAVENIADGAITAAKLAADAITAAKIADGAITAATLATDAISADAFSDGAADVIRDRLHSIQWIPTRPEIDPSTGLFRFGVQIIDSMGTLPTTAQITPGTVSIARKARGTGTYIGIATDTAFTEQNGQIYIQQAFDPAVDDYAPGDTVRFQLKSLSVTIDSKSYEFSDSSGVFYYVQLLPASPLELANTSVATVTSQTEFILAGGNPEDDVNNGHWAVFTDNVNGFRKSMVKISDWDGGLLTLFTESAPDFTIAVGDQVQIMFSPEVTVGEISTTAQDATVDAIWSEAIADHSGTAGSVAERLGRLPDAVAGANGGVPTVDANNRIVGVQGTINDFDGLENLSSAEVQTVIEDNHLDHLFAVAYDATSKPGAADALLNEMVVDDSGVTQWSINSLENAPSGSGASAAAIADAVWTELLGDHSGTAGSAAERLARLPNVAAAANGGLPTVDANNHVAGIQGTINDFDGLENLSSADIQTVVEDNHLDHLFAVAYDATSKPGVADALLNEMVVDDSGVTQWSTNSLENAPSGGGGLTAAEVADAVWTELLGDHSGTAGSAAERLARLPNIASGANGGLPTVDASNYVAGIQGTKNTLDDLTDAAAGPDAATIADQVWNELQSEHVTAGSFGEMATEIATLLTRVPDTISLANINAQVDIALSDYGANTTVPPTAAAIADQVWNELQSEHVTVGSFGEIATEIASIITTLAGLNDLSAGDVNAEMLDVLNTDVFPAATAAPGANATIIDMIAWVCARLLHKQIQNVDGTFTIRNFADTADIGSGTNSDDGTEGIKGKIS